ncbi:MAG: hypothetical protein COZ94_10950 [Nitrospirae bacterium CG_4_8_14_3_um_filter_41_47]|nr:MAG: hypothetical protein COZ94_10950 [Nitrospirae bacterium CG_4_8_14_3_um_filter_41_47]
MTEKKICNVNISCLLIDLDNLYDYIIVFVYNTKNSIKEEIYGRIKIFRYFNPFACPACTCICSRRS